MTKPLGRAKARTKKPKSLRKGPDRRRQIIAAASELFARNGFEGTSIRDIAAASGVLSGSLYYHFPSKEVLLFTSVNGADAVAEKIKPRTLSRRRVLLQRMRRRPPFFSRMLLSKCGRPSVTKESGSRNSWAGCPITSCLDHPVIASV